MRSSRSWARHWSSMRFGDPLAGYRLTATDVDRTRERGPEVSGSAGAPLLLLTGHSVAPEQRPARVPRSSSA